MLDLLKDWRAWFVAALVASYVMVGVVAYLHPPMVVDWEQLDAILNDLERTGAMNPGKGGE